ncbi:hypothetical protein CGSMWGv55152_01970 [Gardnerella vaginalis 55152]|jgi:hypothetical protein|uniref:Uncharacterized protein n=1 Tax=Gardnerella vaginalis 55152 TaxID=698955 RepID=I4LUS6_GARVA|nr:hypothetical protein CGSMWGv55152_01970 [Gardnerella vaginalis 55152]
MWWFGKQMRGGGLGFVVVFSDFGNKLGREDVSAANLRERFACFCFPNRPKREQTREEGLRD